MVKITEAKKKQSADSGNPYTGLQGKSEWNDRYMNMAKAIRGWQLAFGAVFLLAMILAVIVGRLATQSKIQPIAVEVCNGMPKGFLPVDSQIPNADKITNFVIDQFIMNARSVVGDTQAEKSLLNKVYAYSADNTIQFLHDYYQKHNPFELAAQSTVQVNIINSIQLSKNTQQITWDEIRKSTTGDEIISKTRWMATLTYRFGDVNANFMADNPFGIYITNLSWSPVPVENAGA